MVLIRHTFLATRAGRRHWHCLNLRGIKENIIWKINSTQLDTDLISIAPHTIANWFFVSCQNGWFTFINIVQYYLLYPSFGNGDAILVCNTRVIAIADGFYSIVTLPHVHGSTQTQTLMSDSILQKMPKNVMYNSGLLDIFFFGYVHCAPEYQ